jgi:hypothetical protein
MRRTFLVVSLLGLFGGLALAADGPKKALLDDHLLYSARSEDEIVSWAKAKSNFAPIVRFDYVRTERFDIDGKNLLVLLAARPMATQRIQIFVYVNGKRQDGEYEWSLLLLRFTNTADVKIEADKKAKQVVFRSKAGKLLLILPVENIDFHQTPIER